MHGNNESSHEQSSSVTSPGGVPGALLEFAAALHAERGQRAWALESSLFGEPAWDLLLALYVAHGRGYSMKVTDACHESRVPPTTSLRWIEALGKLGYVVRSKHPLDGRVYIVRLTPEAVDRMSEHLGRSLDLFGRAVRMPRD